MNQGTFRQKHAVLLAVGFLLLFPAFLCGQEKLEKTPAEAKIDEAFNSLKSAPTLEAGAMAAEIALKESILLDSSLERPYYNLAILYYHTGRDEEALSLLATATKANQSFGECFGLQGWLTEHIHPERESEIQSLYEKALELDDLNTFANNRISARALQNSDWSKARTHARKALGGNPDSVNAYHNLASAYYHMTRYDLARLVCENGLKKDDKNAPLYNMLGLIKIKQNDVKGALLSFRTSLQHDPDLLDALMNAGAVTLGYNDYTTAEKHFRRATVIETKNIDARISLAVALTGLKKFVEAQRLYEEVLVDDDHALTAHYNLCILFSEHLSDYSKAWKQCDDFQARLPNDHEKKAEMTQRLKGIRDLLEE